MSLIDNRDVVKNQYSTAGNLENRISFHEKYSTNKTGWFNWLFTNYEIRPGDKILELGCGNGKLWAEHDIQNIPYPDEIFDIVIANMMLYHVPDIGKALQEVRRVLKTDGRFFAATPGENGIAGFVRDALGLPRKETLKFTLQSGGQQLQRYFSLVEKRMYDDSLVVTDTKDLAAYIRTFPWSEDLQKISDEEMLSSLEACKIDGVILIPKEYGMFVSYK